MTLSDHSFTMLSRCPVIPVIDLDDPAQAVPLGEALLAGGITIAEITLRTSAGLEAIRLLSEQTELLVGAGSVLVADQVDQVADAGAKFIVSPGLSTQVLDQAKMRQLPALPGEAWHMASPGLLEVEVRYLDERMSGVPAAGCAASGWPSSTRTSKAWPGKARRVGPDHPRSL
jgi:2-dehydro-3-deoxyphosphogluconate aldolase/(4S)-4-hydroxy-2-oxoglutarate aldolase